MKWTIPTLLEESPKIVLVQCGGNDLQTVKANPMPVETIANDIIDAAKICENHGAEHVLVSSIIMRNQHDYMEKRRNELNIILRDMCYDLGFIFVDNENIGHEHLFHAS